MSCDRQVNPAESDISISASDEHVAESRALYQKWGGGAIYMCIIAALWLKFYQKLAEAT
jgi:hypothetical protein